MKVPFFDLGAQIRSYQSELEIALSEVLTSGSYIGGPVVDEFERDFAAFTGCSRAVGVGNGLDALRLVLEGFGIGEGDEVIVPGFTFYATWLAVMQTGATPIPVDVDLASSNIDPTKLEEAVTSSTKAIIAVHLFGRPADMTRLREFSNRFGIKLIEDAAQAHGAMHDSQIVGNLGDAAAFSFYPTKNLGALGDAGAVTTDSETLADFIVSRRSYGHGATKYDHVDFGWNSRLDPIQAKILQVHLGKLDQFTARRRHIASRYFDAIGVAIQMELNLDSDVGKSVWHHFTIRSRNRLATQEWLKSQGVSSDIHYPYFFGNVAPVMQFMSDRNIDVPDLPNSRRISEEIFSLPMGPWMTDEQVEVVCGAISEPGFIETLI